MFDVPDFSEQIVALVVDEAHCICKWSVVRIVGGQAGGMCMGKA